MKTALCSAVLALFLTMGYTGTANACDEYGIGTPECPGTVADAPVAPIAAGIAGLAVLGGGLYVGLRRRRDHKK
ncbi:LPXTG cell wall anchor domain-containing protein [Flexibacterium corallicola]|uniref:LPXTG cell wall anchor domain-containing protein n=1 Tax=Flexibacterium corallicola TaxID=3037259 RepID=UPI00286F5B6B|nr:LPXTG cell wall anchor domain-containing protein [Pseudovibrio sp. M1P-2-3]